MVNYQYVNLFWKYAMSKFHLRDHIQSNLNLRSDTPLPNTYKYIGDEELTSELITATETYNMRHLVQNASEMIARGIGDIETRLHSDTLYQTGVIKDGFTNLGGGLQSVQASIDVSNTNMERIVDIQTSLHKQSEYQIEIVESGFKEVSNGIYSLSDDVRASRHDMVRGFQQVSQHIENHTAVMQDGFQHVNSGLYSLTDAVQTGFEVFSTNMQQGFMGVTQAIHASNHELGNRMIQGFQNVAQGDRKSVV